ncbi:2-oxoglutarate dehydrogenase complex dihydrolipoyllysine-residue succinyltransferase [Candidatus Fukatsuia anoeciicola]|uniref:2-oxoglutarate dehydrogenase complex dihydrolipoyllysine-residue succinyltransferase n=1 Tax=Candidatus Fukatsuia anoeciicola TaxID=2994492 RepID=UPI0034642822
MSSIKILIPDLPESITDAIIVAWHKKPGDVILRDEILLEIETDKVILEVPASQSGILGDILQYEGATVITKQVVGSILLSDNSNKLIEQKLLNNKKEENNIIQDHLIDLTGLANDTLSPAIRRLIAEYNLDANTIKGSGIGGRITREDIDKYLTYKKNSTELKIKSDIPVLDQRSEKRVPMTRIRKRIAERLLEAKNNTAMLTTFNEVNMKPIIDLRQKYGESFEKRHGIRLGFMSFYSKAVLEALKRYPEVNASIDGTDVVYHNYFDISIAVSTPRGLVTPVLRNVETLHMSEIEKQIKILAAKGRDGKLTIEELTGGNFTITNGGIFGSLVSTPIINPPQSAILGMHAIKDRPMAVDGQVLILPMMYLAFSYDHRLIDGRESVSFLVTIKEILENPIRLLLDI